MAILSIIYGSLLVLIFFPRDFKSTKYFEPLSIIIPAYNESLNIKKTLQCIISAKYPSSIEIIVIDDGSEDNTFSIVKEFSKSKNLKMKIIKTNRIGKAKAIEHALFFCSNDIFVIIDADTEIQSNSLTELIQPFSNPKVAAVSATLRVKISNNLLTWFQEFEYAISSCCRLMLDHAKGTCVIPGFCAMRKSIVKQIGGFKGDTVSEDYDICLYLKKAGYEIRMAPSAIAHTKVPETMHGLIHQRIRWFKGTVQVITKHNDMLFSKKFPVIGSYVMPIQLFWILHSFVYIPSMIFLISDGYWTWYASNGDYFSIDVIVFFVKWFMIYGMFDFIYNVLNSNYPLTTYNMMVITVFSLSYCFSAYSILKFSKFNYTTFFVILFFFPYVIFQLLLYATSMISQIINKNPTGNWDKLH